MSKVTLEIREYDNLKLVAFEYKQKSDSLERKVSELESDIAKLKEKHEAEIKALAEDGKVYYVGMKRNPILPFFMAKEKEIKGFEDVKSEVVEQFKQGLFDEELNELKKKQLDCLMKEMTEKETTIDNLKCEIKRMKSRSLWERIRNK